MSDWSDSTAATATTSVGTTTPVAPTAAGGQVYVPSAYTQYATTPVPGLGTKAPVYGSASSAEKGAATGTNVATNPTLSDALTALLHGTPEQILATQKALIKAGYLNPADPSFVPGQIDSSDATYQAYALSLNDSIEQGVDYGKLVQSREDNPHNTTGQAYWQAFQNKMAGTDGAVTGPVTSTSTDTSVNLTNAGDARATAQQEYESMLGRNATDQEAAAFHAGLNAAEQSNPNTQTQTSTADSTDPTAHTESSSSSSGGGVNAGQIADSQIIQQHGGEYAKTQGESIYKLFASMLGG